MLQPRIRHHFLAGDRRFREYRVWDKWLKGAARLSERFAVEADDNPFAYNETASVSLLTAAANQAGLLGLAEYCTVKSRSHDHRFAAHGRCDLWVSSDAQSWTFEFKQLALERFTARRLMRAMAAATKCAHCLRKRDGHVRVAAVIVSLHYVGRADLAASRAAVEKFAEGRSFAWELSSRRPRGGRGLPALRSDRPAQGVLNLSSGCGALTAAEGEISRHPGMALN